MATGQKAGTKHPKKNATRTNLIILSPGRGGSSFLGGIFDSSPQTMFLFEPLFVLKNTKLLKAEINQYKGNSLNLIDAFFKCDFSNVPNAILSAFEQEALGGKMKALTALCPNRRCRPFTNTLLSKTCNSYKHTVVKILNWRLPNNTIQSFQELFQKDRYDVKVIHLVRDPRAVVYSRVNEVQWIKGNYRDPKFRLYVHELCDLVEQNIRMGLLSSSSWLKDRFKVIRFEDLVANTKSMAQQLYRFAGIDWSVSVDQWISAHRDDTAQINLKGSNLYSVRPRNATQVINKWKNAPKELIKGVEDLCGDLMDLLGYEKLLKSDP